MNTYKVYLSDGNDVLIYAAVLSVYDAEATFYDKEDRVCAYFYRPIGIVKL
jgi:hypothetical protein